MRKRHIHPIHVHGLSKSGNLRCFLPHYNSHPPKPEPCIFLYAPFTKEYFYRSSSRTMAFRHHPRIAFTAYVCFIRDQVGLGRFYIILSDNGYVSVVKQPGHRPFAFSRIPFRPRSKAFSTLVKNLFALSRR